MRVEGKIDGRLEKAQKGTTMVFDPRHRAITARCHSRQGRARREAVIGLLGP